MQKKSLNLVVNDTPIDAIAYSTPDFFSPSDAYREIYFQWPHENWHRAVFFRYPKEKAKDDWVQPVEWLDNTMLYVPDLSDASISRAIKYILEQGFVDDACEKCEEPDDVFLNIEPEPQITVTQRSQMEEKIRTNIYNSLLLFKLLGLARDKRGLKETLHRYGNEIIDSLNE